MSNVMEYKGYCAKIEMDFEEGMLHGKIEDVNDLVAFDGRTIPEIEQSFHDAVDEYLTFCKEVGKEPDRPYSGTFNVRISPEMHRALAQEARREGITLNATVDRAIRECLNKPQPTGIGKSAADSGL